MPWPLDERFRIPENKAIIAFIERENPSAHDDVASELTDAAKGLPDVRWYCPDKWSYAYVILHTQSNRIFGIAFGMSGLAFLLPQQMIPEAVADGGEVYSAIGGQWVLFPPWQVDKPGQVTQARLTWWCKVAHDYAVGAKAQGWS